MATYGPFKNAMFEINGTDLSDHVESLTLNYSAEMLDSTAMGDTTRVRKGGLKDWSADVNFHQDLAATEVDATLFTLVGTTACVQIRACNACSSAGNPDFSGIVILESYNPLGGAVGAMLDSPSTFQSAGTLSRNAGAS